MVNVQWTDKAEKRLRETYKRIAQDSSFYARQTVLSIVKRTKILETMPQIGRIVPEFNREDVREVFHKKLPHCLQNSQRYLGRYSYSRLRDCASLKL